MLAKRIIPCLDVKNGRVVKGIRFLNLKDAGDPVEVARRYEKEGADELVFLDITASHEARDTRAGLAARVADVIFIPFTVGGGIRTEKVISEYLDLGVSHVILGTKACNDEKFVGKAIRDFGSGKVFAAVDVKKKDGVVSVTTGGWLNQEAVEPADLVERLVTQGIRTIIYTDVARDGTMSGPAIESYRKILKKINGKASLFASGGVSSLNDLLKLKELEPAGLAGVVVGRALYEKTIDLKEAIQRVG